mmetsp:Transcript_68177/g.188662  ORF Transcript_68177/g.188662 Transcript_68177/m.188662 type:complete len:303 (+) Transcript_68177:526-1434(+)
MERDDSLDFARPPIRRRIAMVLCERGVVVVSPDPQDVPQALVNKHVLAPQAGPIAELVEVFRAAVHALGPGLHCIAREQLQWPVHAAPAVVDVHSLWGLGVRFQGAAQPRGQEDGVRVDLCGPVTALEDAVADDLPPHCHEDGGIQGRPKLTAKAALEVTIDDMRHDARCHHDGHVAVHGMPIASEKAGALIVLHREQLLLIAVRQHEGKAKEGLGLVMLKPGTAGGARRRQPGGRVARQAGDHPPLRVFLGGLARAQALEETDIGQPVRVACLAPTPCPTLGVALTLEQADLGSCNVSDLA